MTFERVENVILRDIIERSFDTIFSKFQITKIAFFCLKNRAQKFLLICQKGFSKKFLKKIIQKKVIELFEGRFNLYALNRCHTKESFGQRDNPVYYLPIIDKDSLVGFAFILLGNVKINTLIKNELWSLLIEQITFLITKFFSQTDSHKSPEYFESMINSISHYGISNSDKDLGYITVFNPGSERILGYKSHEVVGKKKPEDFFKDKIYLFPRIVRRLFDLGGNFEGEVELLGKNEKIVPSFLTISPFKDKEGNILDFVVLIKEIKKEEYDKKLANKDNEKNSYRFIGKSPQIKEVTRQIKIIAKTNLSVLIQGESGTGKELVARSIHNESLRRDSSFIAVDCGGIPENLIESELFGYEKGAFTGAHQRKEGFFELASGGTLFLDEIGNLPLHMQIKLLRALQERRVRRVGGRKDIEADIRIVAASNVPLEKEILEKKFRQDLFFRLNEFIINLPPLRRREVDIIYLANHFLNLSNDELKKKAKGFSPEALNKLVGYHWPGNVRELKNVIKRAVLLCDNLIMPHHLTFFDGMLKEDKISNKGSTKQNENNHTLKVFSERLEKDYIEKILIENGWNKSRTTKI
ncbi:MAG: sigma 54-interacting transcriptional regulator, partial [Thermodesulfobacteriota bacterium]|nr:sigma 54-interacting transcriptional regulator [Thermodesulfobacteriota bacterium]